VVTKGKGIEPRKFTSGLSAHNNVWMSLLSLAAKSEAEAEDVGLRVLVKALFSKLDGNLLTRMLKFRVRSKNGLSIRRSARINFFLCVLEGSVAEFGDVDICDFDALAMIPLPRGGHRT